MAGLVYITPGSRDELRTSGTTVISSPASCRLCGTSTSCVSSARVLGYRFSLRRFPRPASRVFPWPPRLLATARIVRQSELGTSGDSRRAPVFFLDRGNLKRARKRLASRDCCLEHANKNTTERSTLAYHLTLPMSYGYMSGGAILVFLIYRAVSEITCTLSSHRRYCKSSSGRRWSAVEAFAKRIKVSS